MRISTTVRTYGKTGSDTGKENLNITVRKQPDTGTGNLSYTGRGCCVHVGTIYIQRLKETNCM